MAKSAKDKMIKLIAEWVVDDALQRAQDHPTARKRERLDLATVRREFASSAEPQDGAKGGDDRKAKVKRSKKKQPRV